MSRSSNKNSQSSRPNAQDIWQLLENDPTLIESNNEGLDCTTFLIGDSGSGKSSIWQSFLKPNVNKEPKPTFALEYSFARKKIPPAAPGATPAKSLAHIWELGGDIFEPGLLEIPITVKSLQSAAVMIIVDLSKPQNLVESLLKWIKAIREVISKRVSEIKATNNALVKALKEEARRPYSENKDKNRVKPSEIPIYIIASKWDTLKSKSVPSANRRSIIQALRFISHYAGASLFCTSSTDTNLKEGFRGVMGSICFRTPLKSYYEISPDKPVYVTAGNDDFESILLSNKPPSDSSNNSSTSTDALRLVRSESELSEFITPEGITRACWSKFKEFFVKLFGPPDISGKNSSKTSEELNNDENFTANEFPEPEIDVARAEKDAALQRYIIEANRKEALLSKMYSFNNSANDNEEGPRDMNNEDEINTTNTRSEAKDQGVAKMYK